MLEIFVGRNEFGSPFSSHFSWSMFREREEKEKAGNISGNKMLVFSGPSKQSFPLL